MTIKVGLLAKVDQKEKDKKASNSYSGGEKSGIAIQNPDDINAIVEKAKKY